jgi:hypothetical protein
MSNINQTAFIFVFIVLYMLKINCIQSTRFAMPHLYEEVTQLLSELNPPENLFVYSALATDASGVLPEIQHVPGGDILAGIKKILDDVNPVISATSDSSLRGIRALCDDISSKVKCDLIITSELIDEVVKEIATLAAPTSKTLEYIRRLKGICCSEIQTTPRDIEEAKQVLVAALDQDILARKQKWSPAFAWLSTIPREETAVQQLKLFLNGQPSNLESEVISLKENKELGRLAQSGVLNSLVGLKVTTVEEFLTALTTREARGLPEFITSDIVVKSLP